MDNFFYPKVAHFSIIIWLTFHLTNTMVLLDDISYIDDVIEALLRMRYIEQMTIGTSSSSYFICNPPHTDIFIKPYLRENSDIIYVKELVVVSKQLVDSIYKYECFHC